ncbi:MAG: hypothetical protein A3E01_10265 [Gammaproteobacteria bacterium RIFCSPHIGHO2_12_FULL_63_22]|nr:MAG: hypothetical protein A3E01_10265 [Gammaproteobacteria bacterium RIFCSPHIGHO2_12_FULL_63_22]
MEAKGSLIQTAKTAALSMAEPKIWLLGDPGDLTEREKLVLVATIKEALTVNYNPNTVRAYKEDLRAFFDVADPATITIGQVLSVTSSQVAEHRDKMMAEGYANASIRRRLAFLRKFYRFLHQRGTIPFNPIDTVQLPKAKEDEIIVTPLTEEEAAKLLRQATHSWHGRRVYTICTFGLAFGLRRSELARLRTDHFRRDAATGLLQFTVATKGGKPRTCNLSAAVEWVLRRWIAVRGDYDGPLFPCGRTYLDRAIDTSILSATIGALAKRAGIQSHIKSGSERRKSGRWKVGAHTLRATCIYLKYKEGVPIDEIAEMVGHESTEVTWRYLKRIQRDRKNLVSTSCDNLILATYGE